MKIGLLQTRHNALCDFLSPVFSLPHYQCLELQARQVEKNLALAERAAGEGFDLLVTTECIDYIRTANCNRPCDGELYPALDCRWTQALSHAARAAESWLVAGFGYREGECAYNAALMFDRFGILRSVYHKIHLAGDESQVFTPGDSLAVTETDFGRIGLCICYDLQFPETARSLALGGADMIVCPTWGWEADLYGRARAYENGVFVAAAMAVPAWGPISSPRTPSSVAAPDGTILACGPSDREALVCCNLDLRQVARDERLNARRPEMYSR